MRLYDYAASGNCFKVRLLLALLGRDVRAGAGRHLRRRHADRRLRRDQPAARDAGARARRRRAVRPVRRDPVAARRGHGLPARGPLRARAGRAVAVLRAGADHGRDRQPALPAAHGPRRAGSAGTARHRTGGTRVLDAHLARSRVRGGRRGRRSPTWRCSPTSAAPATPASSTRRTSPPGSSASAPCPASSTTSSPTPTTPGPASRARSTTPWHKRKLERPGRLGCVDDSDDLRMGRRAGGVRALAERVLRPRRGRRAARAGLRRAGDRGAPRPRHDLVERR